MELKKYKNKIIDMLTIALIAIVIYIMYLLFLDKI